MVSIRRVFFFSGIFCGSIFVNFRTSDFRAEETCCFKAELIDAVNKLQNAINKMNQNQN